MHHNQRHRLHVALDSSTTVFFGALWLLIEWSNVTHSEKNKMGQFIQLLLDPVKTDPRICLSCFC